MLNLEQLEMLEREFAHGEQENNQQEDVHMDALDEQIKAHEEDGFYVPTREELMDTAGDFFAHLLTERE